MTRHARGDNFALGHVDLRGSTGTGPKCQELAEPSAWTWSCAIRADARMRDELARCEERAEPLYVASLKDAPRDDNW